MAESRLYPIRRIHLNELGGTYGIWQHATGKRPNRAFGFCTDDVSRALVVDLLHSRVLGWELVEASAWLSLAFLRDAFDLGTGRFRNLRSADGRWLDEVGSEDAHARALAALGQAMAEGPDTRFVSYSLELFERALPAAAGLTGLRPIAAALIGCDAALRAGAGVNVDRTFRRLATRLATAFAGLPEEWPWPAAIVTYENAILPRALIVAGRRLGDPALCRTGIVVLDWLTLAQTASDGHLSLIGNNGWWPHGKRAARFDQQPIDAATLVVAAHDAFAATADTRFLALAEMAYRWFLGANDKGVAVADPRTGGCFDGLCAAGVNPNQGAESTLMWLTALEHMRSLRAVVRRSNVPAVQPPLAMDGQ